MIFFRSSGYLFAMVFAASVISHAQEQDSPIIGTTCEEMGYPAAGINLLSPDYEAGYLETLLGETSTTIPGGAILWCVGEAPKIGVGSPSLFGSSDFSILSHNCSGGIL